jgi:four helix bundle protein
VPSFFRDLVAYKLSARLAADAYRAVARWPSFDKWALGMQIVRAADSVPANIAEAAGRWTAPEQRRHLLIARGSLYELEHLLDAARERGLLNDDLSGRVPEIARTLNGLIKRQGRA